MILKEENIFNPDYAVHPGEILLETLEARNMKHAEFARRCGLTEKTVSQIINGNAPITPDTAIQLERVLGTSANVWNNIDANYRLHVARQADKIKNMTQKGWAKKFPVNELRKLGYLPLNKDLSTTIFGLLNFFGTGSISSWENHYNKISLAYRHSPSFQSSYKAVAAWLRIGELCAEEIECDKYNKNKFKLALKGIRDLTRKNSDYFEPKLIDYCRKAGVTVVFVPEFRNTHLNGATRWMNPQKAMIILSLRHKRDDHFWFSFYHEAGHILLHGKKLVFIDNGTVDTKEEKEADYFAANMLIPENEYKVFLMSSITKKSIHDFANKIGIAPGVVVGRLQHDNVIMHSWYVDLTRKFELKRM